MKLLIDTHTLIWAVDNPTKLGTQAAHELRDLRNEILISAATAWEISIKFGLGKLALSKPFRDWIIEAMLKLEATLLPISIDHADTQASLPHHHRDPFDRMLAAQSLAENIALVTGDAVFDGYGVARIW